MTTLLADSPKETVLSVLLSNARRDAEDLYEQLRRVAAEAGFDGEFYALAAAQRRIAEQLIRLAERESTEDV